MLAGGERAAPAQLSEMLDDPVDRDGNTTPDVIDSAGVLHYDAGLIEGAGSDMVTVAIDGETATWRLTAANAGSVTVGGCSAVSFTGIATLSGADGDDTFVFAGGSVSGAIAGGGFGANTLDYSSRATGVSVNLASATATGTAAISGIQNAIGGAGNDTLTGDGENNSFTGGPGRDMINGSAGLDTLVEARNADVTPANTSLTIGSEGSDTVSGIEAARLTGGTGGNSINASMFTRPAVLDGDGGNDTLRSSSGITDLTARVFCAKVSNGIAGDYGEATGSSAATTGNLFRYDPASGQYVFNWGTKGSTIGTYQIRVDLGDGSAHTVLVSLK